MTGESSLYDQGREFHELHLSPRVVETRVWQDLEVIPPLEIMSQGRKDMMDREYLPEGYEVKFRRRPLTPSGDEPLLDIRAFALEKRWGYETITQELRVSLLQEGDVIPPTLSTRNNLGYILQLIPGNGSELGKLGIMGPFLNRKPYYVRGVALYIQTITSRLYSMRDNTIVPQIVNTPLHELKDAPEGVRKYWLTGSTGVFDPRTRGYNPYLHIGLRLYEKPIREPRSHWFHGVAQIMIPIPTYKYPHPQFRYFGDWGFGAGVDYVVTGFEAAETDSSTYNKKTIMPGLYVICHAIVPGEEYRKYFD